MAAIKIGDAALEAGIQAVLVEPPLNIDGRAEVFFDTSYFDYQQITRLEPGWQDKLRRWKVDTMLVSAGEALAGAIAHEPEWRQIYRDKRAVIYQRADLPAKTPAKSARLQKQEVNL